MTKKNYSKYEAKEELVTLSFNHVLLHKKDTKIYQVIFLSLLNYFYCSLTQFSLHSRCLHYPELGYQIIQIFELCFVRLQICSKFLCFCTQFI